MTAFAQKNSHQPAVLSPISSTGGQGDISIPALAPILVASPHPDDETLGCGGLIARCAQLGVPVTVLAMTCGEASHPGDTDWQQKLASIRHREQRNALHTLGLASRELISLNLPDGGLAKLEPFQVRQVMDEIVSVIRSRGIHTTFSPAIDDCHDDHQMTARWMARAASLTGTEHFFSFQIWPPQNRAEPVLRSEVPFGHWIDDLLDLKSRAIRQHRSQLEVIDPVQPEGFQLPEELLEEKLTTLECYAQVRDLTAWLKDPI